jgi:exoribonuclease-2
MAVQPGNLLEFCSKNQVIVGVCQYANPQHVRVLTEHNKELNLAESKIAHVLKRSLPSGSNRVERVEAMKAWGQKVQATADNIDLAMLWEVLEGESEALDLATLAGMYFSDVTDELASGLLRALAADRIYFDRKGETHFTRRSPETVQQVLQQREREANKKRDREVTLQWLKQSLPRDVKQAPPPPPEAESYVTLFQQLTVLGKKSNQYSAMSDLFQEAGFSGNLEDLCFNLLVKTGVWDEDVNLHLIEQNVPIHFSQELLNHAAALQLDVAAYHKRPDLRGIYTISIDDADTTDIDDALSWEAQADGGYRLWIHIADPAEFVTPEAPLDREAAKRFTSIYLCERKIEMLPVHLSQGLCSLVAGEPRLALSVRVDLTPELDIRGYEIVETLIQVTRRMTYDDVDAEVDGDERLQQMLALAQKLKEQRMVQGAVDFSGPELRIKVTADKEIQLKLVERNSASQHLVSELMILANHLVAKRLNEAGVPMIYKVQEAPTEENAQGRPLIKRAEMSTRMNLHYGLGLKAYTQFTSPIRRYNDLVLHRQIKGWLREGKACYSEEQLQHIIALSDQAIFSANFIQRENFRYWLYKYFSQLPTPRLLEAEASYVTDDRAFVTLLAYSFDVPFPMGDGPPLKQGERLWVSLDNIHPRKGQLSLRRAQAPVAVEAAAP